MYERPSELYAVGSPSERTASRRAIRSLQLKGLIDVWQPNHRQSLQELLRAGARLVEFSDDVEAVIQRIGPDRYVKPRYARRTRLGEWVVDSYRSELESGGRIRWRSPSRDELLLFEVSLQRQSITARLREL